MAKGRSYWVRLVGLVCVVALFASCLTGCVPAVVAGVVAYGIFNTKDAPDYEMQPNYDSDGGYTPDYGGSWGGSTVKPKNCAYCRNTGKVDCSSCGGDGGKYEYYSAPNYSGSLDGPATSKIWKDCWRCNSTGKVDCWHCG